MNCKAALNPRELCVILLVVLLAPGSLGAVKRCYQCRSRGPLGDCKDPFNVSETDIVSQSIPCASGWCAKIVEGHNLRDDDFGTATERICLLSSPSDSLGRCTEAVRKDKKVFMCTCRGDLCNGSTAKLSSLFLIGALAFWVLW